MWAWLMFLFSFNMDEVGISRRGLPKFSEILRRPREAEVRHCKMTLWFT